MYLLYHFVMYGCSDVVEVVFMHMERRWKYVSVF